MSDDSNQAIETISETTDSTMENQVTESSNYSDVDPGAGETDDSLRNFGGAIAVCALLALFGGQTFAWWGIEISADFFGSKIEITGDFGTNEFYAGIGDETNGTAYDDKELGFDKVDSVFSILKIMLYALVICGAALGYMGHSGEKREFEAKVIAATAVISIIIILYVFLSLPKAYDEDTEFFDDMGEDPSYFFSEEEEGVETKTSFGLGMLLPLVSLGICGYMVKDRGITLEDITG
tara:strand:- start:209 stop:919 length:711 start_codon:yes stop_codon:yes gene_type:complete